MLGVQSGLRWATGVAREVALAPQTVAGLRESLPVLVALGPQMSELAALGAEIRALTDTLQETIPGVGDNVANLDQAMGRLGGDLQAFRAALEGTLPELATLVGGMDHRVQRMEDMINQLGESILALMGAIPGVRRALRDARPATVAARPPAVPSARPR